MMLRSLYAKLALALLGLLALMGGLLVVVSVTSTELYQQEASQKLNRTLAELIVSERDLMRDRTVNGAAVKEIFSMLMTVNPSIEVYLLDAQGTILSYSAEPGRVKRTAVDLAPVTAFLEGKSVKVHAWELVADGAVTATLTRSSSIDRSTGRSW